MATFEAIPAVVDFTTVARGTGHVTVKMPVNGSLAIAGTDTTNMELKNWTVDIGDPSVLILVPADFSGRTASLPHLVGVKPGATTAVVTYNGGTSPEVVTYEVTVQAG